MKKFSFSVRAFRIALACVLKVCLHPSLFATTTNVGSSLSLLPQKLFQTFIPQIGMKETNSSFRPAAT